MVVLKSGLTHSYWKIHSLNERSALYDRGQSRNWCNPQRTLFLWRQCSTAARGQAEERAESQCAQRDRQQGLTKDDCDCRSAH